MVSKPQILVVEDDKRWQEIYREALVNRGYDVQITGDKMSALQMLDRMFFHSAIVDLKLSDNENNRDGLDVLRRIWALDEGTRAIVGSGYLDISMFDEFQRMGIFSLTEIPTEARKQIDRINFFNGIIKKDDPLQKILDTVDTAVEESWRKSIKQQWSQSPFKIIRDLPAKEVQRLLRIGKIEELRPFLSSLVKPLFPWLLPKTGNTTKISTDTDQIIAFECIAWSRAKGKCVAIRFGRQDYFEESFKIMPVASAHPGINATRFSEGDDGWTHLIAHPLEGMVFELDNMAFTEHFEPPVRKKDL